MGSGASGRFSGGTRTWTQVAAGLLAFNIMSNIASRRAYYSGNGPYYRTTNRKLGSTCTNMEDFNGTVLNSFQCPIDGFTDDDRYCCGPENYEYCCKFLDDTGRGFGVLFAVIASIGIIFGICICIVKLKSRNQLCCSSESSCIGRFFQKRVFKRSNSTTNSQYRSEPERVSLNFQHQNRNFTPRQPGPPNMNRNSQPTQYQQRPQHPANQRPAQYPPNRTTAPYPPGTAPLPYPAGTALLPYPPGTAPLPYPSNQGVLPYPNYTSIPQPTFNTPLHSDNMNPPPPPYSEVVGNSATVPQPEHSPLLPQCAPYPTPNQNPIN